MIFTYQNQRFQLFRHDVFTAKQLDDDGNHINADHDYIRIMDGNWRKRNHGPVSPDMIAALDRQVITYTQLVPPRRFAPLSGAIRHANPNSERPRFRTPREKRANGRVSE